jgi:hypothetical protein
MSKKCKKVLIFTIIFTLKTNMSYNIKAINIANHPIFKISRKNPPIFNFFIFLLPFLILPPPYFFFNFTPCQTKQPSWHLQILILCLLQIRPISIGLTLNFFAISKASTQDNRFFPFESPARSRTAFIKSCLLPIFVLQPLHFKIRYSNFVRCLFTIYAYALLDISKSKNL